MRTVDNPKELFREIDASPVDGDSYTFKVGRAEDEDSEPQALAETIQKNSVSIEKQTVEFEDLSDPATDFHASLKALEEAATVVDSEDEAPENADAKFRTQEDGRVVTYIADTTRMGYEVVKQSSGPRLAGYTVIFPDAVVKVEP